MKVFGTRLRAYSEHRNGSALLAMIGVALALVMTSLAPPAEASRESYDNGYNAGEKAGRNDGYDDGFKDAWHRSFRGRLGQGWGYNKDNVDYDRGWGVGYDRGYATGWRIGQIDGRKEGRSGADRWRKEKRERMREYCETHAC